ncbi:MAG: tetratricopeptide repeat protein [Phycisphaerales bacterium]|nr:tetratricopeptide repeat protein [Phycisphaerales bacterium]
MKLMRIHDPIPQFCSIGICAAVIQVTIGCSKPLATAEETQPALTATVSVVASIPPSQSHLSQPVIHQNLPIAAKLVRSGQFLDAEIILRSMLRESPDCARCEFLLGVAVMKTKRYGQARPLLESSVARNQQFPERIQVDHFLGWTCYYLGDLESSKRHFQSHIAAVPTADDSYFGLGVIAIDEDRTADAQLALERAIELIGMHPVRARDRAKCLARLGDIELRRDRREDALSLYEESARLCPDHGEVWGKLARVYDSLNRPAEAEAARAKQSSFDSAGRAAGTDLTP